MKIHTKENTKKDFWSSVVSYAAGNSRLKIAAAT